jgi:dipeptidyl aminopeptidase/acylaminoacyl peptidase
MANEDEFKTCGPLTIDQLVEITPPAEPDLSPDGKRVVYAQAVGEVRQLFAIPVAGGWPLRLTAGEKSCESPRWSPDGSQITFVRDKSLLVMQANGANVRTLVEHAAGLSLPRWSPDGSQVAFYSRQRGWSQIWLVPAGGGEARRLTIAPADNDDLAWSPDGSRIAYSSIRGDDLFNRDIYSVDIASGTETRLTAAPGCFDGAPSWSPDGTRIAFLSDQDGWIHVYAMGGDGSNRRQLSFGACEDGWPNLNRGHLLWSPDGAALAFVRNREANIDLMTLSLADGAVRRVSTRDGMHQPVGWVPEGSAIVCLIARPDAPHDLWLLPHAGEPRQITYSLSGGARAEDFVVPERVAFESSDGLRIHGLLFRPRGHKAGERCPAIVNPHGGPTGQSFVTWSEQIVQLFVQEGYAVLQPDFRGSSGYGKAFRQANMGVWGVADTADCIDAARYLQTLPWVNPERLGIWGGSYGGYLVFCSLIAAPDLFRAGIDLYGDSEIAESYRHGDRVGRLDLHRQMGSPDDNATTYRSGSPVYQAERLEAPLLILHGKDDLRVAPLMSERMIEALKIEGKFFEHHFYEGEGHGFRKLATRRDAARRMLRFFEKHLTTSPA